MRFFNSALIATIIALTVSETVCADSITNFKSTTSTDRMRDSTSDNAQKLDCTKSKNDPRCGYPQRPQYPVQHPGYYPQQYPQRPVIINQLPEQPAIEINSLTDDWDGCRKAKLGAINARKSGHVSEANNLDEWLWKNCRSYSNELRQLEQDDM